VISLVMIAKVENVVSQIKLSVQSKTKVNLSCKTSAKSN